jgi:hypothetical protein
MRSPRLPKKGAEHFPSLAEVKQDKKWPIYEEILHRYEVRMLGFIRATLSGAVITHSGEDSVERSENIFDVAGKEFKDERDYAEKVFETFCLFFSPDSPVLDKVAEIDHFIDILCDIRDGFQSEAVKRHNMLDELRAAGASWAQIAAMLTDEWEGLEQGERESVADSLHQNHKNYRKKYPPDGGIVNPKTHTRKKRGTK